MKTPITIPQTINSKQKSPKCSDIYISTKTKIVYLDRCIDLKNIFWLIKVIPYGVMQEGVIKKQMKFNSTKESEVEELVKKTEEYEYATTHIIQQIIIQFGCLLGFVLVIFNK